MPTSDNYDKHLFLQMKSCVNTQNWNKTFQKAPLLMINMVVLAAKFGWTVPPDVMEAAQANAHRIQIVAPQRVMEELEKTANAGVFHKAIAMMSAIGVLKHIMPEVEAMKGVGQDPRFHAEGAEWGCKNFERR